MTVNINDKLDTIMLSLRTIRRQLRALQNRRNAAKTRQQKYIQRSKITRSTIAFLSGEELSGHAPLADLRTYLHIDYPRRSVYRFLRRVQNREVPSLYVQDDEVFYEAS